MAAKIVMSRLPHRLRYLFVLLLFILFYTVPRLMVIFRYPIFNDEAIYLRYGKIMIETPQRFYTLAVIGKQPLVYWVYGLLGKYFDPLIASRLVSVVFGLGTLIAIFLISKFLFGSSAARLAALLYAISPLTVFFDSLALVDGILAAIFALLLLLLVRLSEKFTWQLAMLAGLLLGIAVWVKTTVIIFAAVVLFGLVYLWYKRAITSYVTLKTLLITLGIVGLAVALLFARPEADTLVRYQGEYSLTLRELFFFPVGTWVKNALYTMLVLVGYVSPIIVVAAVVTMFHKDRVGLRLLGVCVMVALTMLIFLARSLHGRYILFAVMPLFPLAAATLWRSKILTSITILSMGLLSAILAMDARVFFHLFPQVSVYANEAYQYVDGWPSGYGVQEALKFIDDHRQEQSAFVGVRWDSGNPEDTVLLYAPHYSGLSSGFLDARLEDFPLVVAKYKDRPMYFITRNGQRAYLDRQLKLLARFPKPRGEEAVEVYRFQP